MSSSKLLEDFVKRRDEGAFAELVRLYGPLVYGVCRRTVGSHHDAEDAFQATFLILSQKAASVRNSEVLPSWLYRVAYQVSLRARATMNKRRTKETSMTPEYEPVSVEPNGWVDLEPVLDLELNRLSDKYRAAIVLCDIGGSTLKDAANELGWTQGTLATRLTKARSILAERLARHGFALTAGAMAVLISQNAASAAVPASLVVSTLQTASAASAGQAASAGLASSKIVALAQGTLKSALLFNLKIGASILLVLATAVVGLQTQAEKPKGAAEITLPVEVRNALEQNAAQLSPITISFTEQLKSQLPEQETLERLKIFRSNSAKPYYLSNPHFELKEFRVIWQDQKYYNFRKEIPDTYSEKDVRELGEQQRECCFDGDVLSRGGLNTRSDELDRAHKSQLNGGISAHDFFKSPYFQGDTGISFPPQYTERKTGMVPESSILGSLRRGGKLISVKNEQIDDRPQVRVELVVENMERRLADSIDFEAQKKTYKEGPFSPEERDQLIENMITARQLPKTKRLVFYLDPALNYAVRQKEEWYEPGTLLQRCTCSDFQQLPNRNLWLPKRYEIDYRTFPSTPGVIFEQPFLSQVVNVTELSGDRVHDGQFVLNYTRPGVTIVENGIVIKEGQSKLSQPSTLTYSVGRTPEETQRNRDVAIRTAPAISKTTVKSVLNAAIPKSPVQWFLFANVVAVLLIGGVLVYRRFFRF